MFPESLGHCNRLRDILLNYGHPHSTSADDINSRPCQVLTCRCSPAREGPPSWAAPRPSLRQSTFDAVYGSHALSVSLHRPNVYRFLTVVLPERLSDWAAAYGGIYTVCPPL